jgi:hypothetical protein
MTIDDHTAYNSSDFEHWDATSEGLEPVCGTLERDWHSDGVSVVLIVGNGQVVLERA